MKAGEAGGKTNDPIIQPTVAIQAPVPIHHVFFVKAKSFFSIILSFVLSKIIPFSFTILSF